MNRIYVLYDLVAKTWIGQLITQKADAPVIRMFIDLLQDKTTQPAQHPADYELRFVGIVDEAGQLTPCEPLTVATGAGWLAMQQASTPEQG